MSYARANYQALKMVSGPLEFRIDPSPAEGPKIERFVFVRSDPVEHESIVDHRVNAAEIKNSLITAIFERNKNTSDTLTAVEVASVSEYLNDCSSTLDGLGNEMQILRTQIESLCSQYTTLACRTVEKVDEMDVVRLLFAPMRRIPPEVLTMIFRLTLPRHTNRPHLRVNAVLRLSLVCKVWRDVIREDSSLWQHHFVTIPDSQAALASSLPDRMSSLAELQARARIRPMRLTIRDMASNFNETPQMTAIMDFLVSSFAKYSHLDFQPLSLLWQDYFEGRGVSLGPTLLSNLVSMRISMQHHFEDGPTRLIAFANAHQLQEVTLDVFDPRTAEAIKLPSKNLTTFHLRVRAYDDDPQIITPLISLYRILAKHAQVREASLAFLNTKGSLGLSSLDPFTDPLPIVSYSVLVACEGEASQTLELLNLAVLENFQFEATVSCRFTVDVVAYFETYDGEEPLLAFDFSMVADTFGRLTSLVLIRVSFTKEECRQLFTTTPLLKSLRLFVAARCTSCNLKLLFKFNPNHPRAMNEEFLDLLSEHPSEDNIRSNNFILPHLEDLHLFHPCHIPDNKLLKQAKKYNKLVKTRAGLLASKAQLHSASPSGSNLANPPDFKFTLSFSEEHDMRADIPTIMKELEGTAAKLRPLCAVDVGYEVVDSFEWKPEAL